MSILDTTENMSTAFKSWSVPRNPKIYMISVKKSGKNIQPELRQKFVDGYQKHVVEVQLANRGSTKY